MNIGDIVICSRDNYNGSSYLGSLVIGRKYLITEKISPDIPNVSDSDRSIIFVKDIETGNEIHYISQRMFISLEVYRDLQIREILKNESQN